MRDCWNMSVMKAVIRNSPEEWDRTSVRDESLKAQYGNLCNRPEENCWPTITIGDVAMQRGNGAGQLESGPTSAGKASQANPFGQQGLVLCPGIMERIST